jgi:hypothetical protein
MSLKFLNKEFDKLNIMEEFLTFKYEPRSRLNKIKKQINTNDNKQDMDYEKNKEKNLSFNKSKLNNSNNKFFY